MMIKIIVFCLMLFPLTISAAWELCPTGAPHVQYGFADDSSLYFITRGIPGVEAMKMYRTGDYGGSWEEVSLPVHGRFVYWKCTDTKGAYSFYGSDSGVCWSNDGVHYRQTNEITVENKDTVYSWRGVTAGSVTEAPIQLGQHWFIATYHGLIHSLDSGQSWIIMDLCSDDLPAIPVFDCRIELPFRVIKTLGSLLIGGISKAITVSPDTGKTWSKFNVPSTGSISAIAITPGGIFASDQSSGVYFSADTGKSWVSANDSLPRYTRTKFERIREMVTINDKVYISVRPGVFTFEENRWVKVGIDYPDNVFTNRMIPFKNTLCCLTTDGAYHLENNKWKLVAFRFSSAHISGTSIVGYNSQLFAGTGAGVFKSSDCGTTWKNVSGGIAGQLYIDDVYPCSLGLFANNNIMGAYRWNAASEQWRRLGNDSSYLSGSSSMAEYKGKLLFSQNWGDAIVIVDPENTTVDAIKVGYSNSILCINDTIFSTSRDFRQITDSSESGIFVYQKPCGLIRSSNDGDTWESICGIPEILYLA